MYKGAKGAIGDTFRMCKWGTFEEAGSKNKYVYVDGFHITLPNWLRF